MGSFGENLRRERELRGTTLPELANATKINLRHLQALEDDRFDLLPGGVFSRGFVRAIARYLKLDENHWVGELARAANEPPEVLACYAPPPRRSGSPGRAKWRLALLMILFGVGAYFVHTLRLQRAAEASAVAAPAMASVALPQAGSEKPAPPPREDPAAVANSPQPRPASLPPLTLTSISEPASPPAEITELRLQIDVVQDAWVEVIVDGEPAYEGMMRAGSTRNVRGTRQIELVTENASAVVLTLNSETLAPLGQPGEHKKVILTAKDLLLSTP